MLTDFKNAKTNLIDHPADPENKELRHFCTESDEPLLFYRGKIKLDENGEATVKVPDYVELGCCYSLD